MSSSFNSKFGSIYENEPAEKYITKNLDPCLFSDTYSLEFHHQFRMASVLPYVPPGYIPFILELFEERITVPTD
jgi:hypothetical protein